LSQLSGGRKGAKSIELCREGCKESARRRAQRVLMALYFAAGWVPKWGESTYLRLSSLRFRFWSINGIMWKNVRSSGGVSEASRLNFWPAHTPHPISPRLQRFNIKRICDGLAVWLVVYPVVAFQTLQNVAGFITAEVDLSEPVASDQAHSPHLSPR